MASPMMLSSPGRTAPRSPAKSPARRALPKYESKHNDDIDCVNWLAEIGMTQYAETFLVNLSPDGKILSRKRLGQIRQNDLPKMNIVSFVHQKLLMEHIRHVLNHEFDSPLRRKEVKELNNRHGLADEKAQEKEKHPVHYISTEAKLAEEMKHNNDEKDPLHKKVGARRRRSFDHQVWQSISNLRTKQSNIASAADSLREGIFQEAKPKPKSSHRRRRWSFGEGEKAGTTFDKAQQYGNLAQEYDMMLSNLRSLQEEYLSEVRSIVNCEVASILFLNDRTRDLMLYAGNSWYRIPCGTGIAGYCAETGENLNITDAYADFRFNSNLDIRTGFKTRNILCQPVRGVRGGGNIIGVIQMINKKNGQDFDKNDEDALLACVQRIADVLSAKFNDLLTVADRFAGSAIFVGGKSGEVLSKIRYNSSTASSRAGRERRNSRTTSPRRSDAQEKASDKPLPTKTEVDHLSPRNRPHD